MAGLEHVGRVGGRVSNREGGYHRMVGESSFGDGRVGGNICPLFLLLHKCTYSVFRVIKIRLRKHHLATYFYVICASTATHFIFFIHVNTNVCVPSCTLASRY